MLEMGRAGVSQSDSNVGDRSGWDFSVTFKCWSWVRMGFLNQIQMLKMGQAGVFQLDSNVGDGSGWAFSVRLKCWRWFQAGVSQSDSLLSSVVSIDPHPQARG